MEGNEGSDTYYITNHTTTTDINNFAHDRETDYLILGQNLEDIDVKRDGNDAVLWNTDSSDKHLVKLKDWFLSENYRHLAVKTHDRLLSNISATGRHGELELLPFAFNGANSEDDLTFDAQEKGMSHVLTLTGSSHDDHLYGNDLDNQGGSDTITGRNGKDVYLLKDNSNAQAVISNIDILFICVQSQHDVKLAATGNDLKIRSKSCRSEVTIEEWFLGEDYRHLLLVPEDGEILNISTSGPDLKLHVIMVDLSFQR